MGQPILAIEMLIKILINCLKVNHVNPLLYLVSAINFPRPEHDVLGISIGDFTSRSAFLSLTLLSDCKQYTEDYWFVYSDS